MQAYTTPEYFQDDWLNSYYDIRSAQQAAAAKQQAAGGPGQQEAAGQQREGRAAATGQTFGCVSSDYRFVYLGPKVSS